MPSKRILVVDDETTVRETVKMILEHDGHTVSAASNASEALSKLETESFDLVLTDYMMPGMRGDQLAQEIRRKNPQQRIALLTGYPPAVLPTYCDLMLLKPCSVTEIRNAVAALT